MLDTQRPSRITFTHLVATTRRFTLHRAWLLARAIRTIVIIGCALSDGTSGLAIEPPGEEAIGCTAPAEWFKAGGTKEADYSVALDKENDCAFYRFAWQTFLFATDSGGQQPRFLSFATPEEVFGHIAVPTFPKRPDDRVVVLSPRVLKPQGVRDIDEVFQAVSQGVVVDSNGRAIYYGLHMNDAFVSFVRRYHLTTPDGIAKASPALMFEPGCLEFKSAWKIVAKDEDVSSCYSRMAKVPSLSVKDGKVIVDNTKPARDERVALVGLHVVGVAKDHPEFIWATFEHIKNAPDLPADLLNFDSTGSKLSKSASAVTTDDWTFCRRGSLAKDCNVLDKATLTLVDEAAQKLSPVTPLFRHYAFGGDDPRGIMGLNASVHEKLPKDDWRRNYEMIGAVWIDDPLNADGPFVGCSRAIPADYAAF